MSQKIATFVRGGDFSFFLAQGEAVGQLGTATDQLT
jgi:hypothetical protein